MLDLALPDHGADPQLAIDQPDLAQPGDSLEIDEVPRPHPPHREQRQQALATGQNLRIPAVGSQDLHSLLRAGRWYSNGGALMAASLTMRRVFTLG